MCIERFPPNLPAMYLHIFTATPIVLKARLPSSRLVAWVRRAILRSSSAVGPVGGNLSMSPVPARPIRELPRLVGHLTSVEALPLARLAPPLSEHGRVGALEGNMRDVHEGDEETQRIQWQRYNAKMDYLLGRVPSVDALAFVLRSKTTTSLFQTRGQAQKFSPPQHRTTPLPSHNTSQLLSETAARRA